MSDDNGNSPSGSGSQQPPTIAFTRKRTTTKTRTAASSARRRKNIPLCHASGGGEDTSGKEHSWFARKASAWTDDDIRDHVVSGGATRGGEGVSIVGDVVMGVKEEKKKSDQQRRGGPRFAWEEEDENGDGVGNIINNQRMTAAPTLFDIMDEQDKVDYLAPSQVNREFDANNTSKPITKKSRRRSQNAALAELAQVSGAHSGSAPTSANESIGWRLLRVWGYRSRLGIALVPLSGYDKNENALQELDSLSTILEKSATHERKWLASKRLRAIRLPSIRNNDPDKQTKRNIAMDIAVTDSTKNSKILVIPPPKLNKHGIGFDPFKNAPEFREFHERRRLLAQKRGKEGGVESGGGSRSDRYFTDKLGKDARGGDRDDIRGLWGGTKPSDRDEYDDEDEDDTGNTNDNRCPDHSHYAADRNYTDFIGTKASSGFALEDEDDTNVYQDDEGHSFPHRDKKASHDAMGQYALEVQSPVASDEEDNDGLFGKSAHVGRTTKAEAIQTKQSDANVSNEDRENLAGAWSAWGMGVEEGGASTAAGNVTLAQRTTTLDGKPPLTGFALSQKRMDTTANIDAPKRWKGPSLPSGYVLKRHVFQPEKLDAASDVNNRLDSGLGLDLSSQRTQQHRQHHQQRQPQSIIPRVLPPSDDRQPSSDKMMAKNGTEMNFHAVRESMKNRFVTSGSATEPSRDMAPPATQHRDEWVDVTITTWLPTRLLCKRWGVPVPSASEGLSATSTVGDPRPGGEEEYFRQMVYGPVVANQQQTGEATKGGEATTNGSTDIHGTVQDDEDTAPPPTRPSESVFQSIYDVDESDMDISSSDEDESFIDAKICQLEDNAVDTTKYANYNGEVPKLEASNEVSTKAVDPVAADPVAYQTPRDISPHRSPSHESLSESDQSSSSNSERDRRRRKRRHRHRRSHRDGEDDSSTDSDRHKKKKKHRSRSRHKEKK
eukprot:scaffold825_cov196-Alexandrium_tamarense.AAC.1